MSCPDCHQLTHTQQLDQLAAEARAFEASGNDAEAGKRWAQCLMLLPPDSKQAVAIGSHLEGITRRVQASSGKSTSDDEERRKSWSKRFGAFGVVAAMLWKFKVFVLLALSKFKLLIFGLTKLKTLLSMLASIGFYWSLYGWRFALGFIGGIYVHEMGHVFALRQLGIRAGAPMFIPGLGAFVSLYESPKDEVDDAKIGLAGPLWGMAFTLVAAAAVWLTGNGALKAITHVSAYINLFNLIPIWQLDGGRGFRALTQGERYQVLAVCAGMWFVTSQGIYLLIILGALYRIFWVKDPHPRGSDAGTQFVLLLAVLGALAMYAS